MAIVSRRQVGNIPLDGSVYLSFVLVRFSVSLLMLRLPALLVSVFTDGAHINIIVELHICVPDAAEKCAAGEVFAVGI